MFNFISAEEAKRESDEARKHYREEERNSLLEFVYASIVDACKQGEYWTTVEVPEEDTNFLYDYLKEKGYRPCTVAGDAKDKIEIYWD